MNELRFYRIKPARSRVWHATESWSLAGIRNGDGGGVTLCRRAFGSLEDQVVRADAPELVDCGECRVVLENRARRAEEEARDNLSARLIEELQELDAACRAAGTVPGRRPRNANSGVRYGR